MELRRIWSYRPVDYRTWPSLIMPQVQEIIVDNKIETDLLRFHFTNKNGVSSLHMINLKLDVIRNNQQIIELPINFSGQNILNLKIDEETFSDKIRVNVRENDQLRISTVFPERTYVTSGVVTYSQLDVTVNNYELVTGRRIHQDPQYKMVAENPRMTYFVGLDAIEMNVPADFKVVSIFGDSITQQSFYVNHLRQELNRLAPGKFGVNNCGIGGNRILHDTDPIFDKWYRHGLAGLKRFESDLFGNGADPDIVFVFHGVNDVIQETIHPGEVENVEDIIAGLVKYSNILSQHQTTSIIGTLLPLGNSIFYSPDVEKKRQQLNNWIRKQQLYSAIVDMEGIAKDMHNQKKLQVQYDSGDGLHPNDCAGQMLAKEIAKVIIAN